MIGRDRRYRRNRRVGTRGRVGIATAVLAGAAATAAAATAVVSGGHGTAAAGTAAKAAPAAYMARYSSEGAILATALDDWSWSHSRTYAELAKLTKVHGFSQVKHDGTTLDVQRGIVVLATKKFLIVESPNHSLHLWLLSSHTSFKNVSASTAGTAALTGNAWATKQAMTMNNMVPAANWMAGSTSTAANLLTPTAAPQTVTVQVAGTDLTVTVTITSKTATVSQTATTPTTGSPSWDPQKYTQYAWHATASLTRGDLVLVAGTRSHGVLHAQLVLFAPLSQHDVAGGPAPSSATPTADPTAMPTHQ